MVRLFVLGGGVSKLSTEEEIGYHDAIRQISKSLQRRLKTLEDKLKEADEEDHDEIQIRMDELEHMVHTLESLHR